MDLGRNRSCLRFPCAAAGWAAVLGFSGWNRATGAKSKNIPFSFVCFPFGFCLGSRMMMRMFDRGYFSLQWAGLHRTVAVGDIGFVRARS
jgi:hypothetical protein